MKKQVLTAILLHFMFAVFLISIFINEKKEETYRILKVVEADTFYIDINKNNKADDNELFKIKNIVAFSPIKNQKTDYYIKKLNIRDDIYLKNGYLARAFAKEELTNKEISMVLPENSNNYADIKYKNENLAEFLLKNGLAFVYENSDNPQYFQFQNLKQAEANAKEISQLDFSLVNLKTKIVHKLNGEHHIQIKNGELFLRKQTEYLNFALCKSCFKNEIETKNDNLKSEFNIQVNKNSYPKSLNKKFGDIELFLINPLEFKKPNKACDTDICKRIIKEINQSTRSIDIALYGINEQEGIVEALRAAKKRGVKIRAVMDNGSNTKNIYPYSIEFIKEFRAKTGTNKTFMHNKFMIFDDKTVLTGSINVSASGTGGYNANNAVIIKSDEIAKIYKNEFNQMYGGKFSLAKEKTDKPPISMGETTVEVYFSPKDDVLKNGILPIIQKAKNKIYVSAFYLTDRNLIKELIRAKNRNVEVVVLLDAAFAMNFKDRVIQLRSAKIPVKIENWGGKNHEKTILADDEYLIIGSCNFTISGFYKNDENILIIKNPKIASFYGDYFLYLFNSVDNKYLKLFPRSESFESKNSCYDGIDNDFDGKTDLEDEGCKPEQ